MKAKQDKTEFFVDRLKSSMQGAGTNEPLLTWIIVSRSEVSEIILHLSQHVSVLWLNIFMFEDINQLGETSSCTTFTQPDFVVYCSNHV